MADCQLGCYATFSGMGEAEIADFATRGMRVARVPKTEGFEWDATRYRTAVDAVRALRAKFVVMGGDMVDDVARDDQLAELLKITDRLNGVPMWWAPGNHDAAADALRPTP